MAKAEADYVPPHKPATINDKPVSPIDYVLDFNRCTFVFEDPYVMAVLYTYLKRHVTEIKIIRTKNRLRAGTHNILMNAHLAYPATLDSFEKARLPGAFDEAFAGRPIVAVEIQMMLNDYLTIKEVMHKYYEAERAKENFHEV